MGNNGYRFTNEMYATKREVQQKLNITMVDKFWNEILEFRSQFNKNLGIKSIDGISFSICYAPSISEKLTTEERKIMKIFSNYLRIDSSLVKDLSFKAAALEILQSVSNSLRLNVSNDQIKQIVNDNISTISPENMILQKYYFLLKELYSLKSVSSLENIENYLDEICSTLLIKNEETNSYYRDRPISNNSFVYTSNVYEESPVKMIEPLMNELFGFLKTSNQSYLVKAIVALFYINYLKPFESYNELISALIAKYIIINSDFDGVGSLLNFEKILLKDEKYVSSSEETKKTKDLTYYLNIIIEKLDLNLDDLIDHMIVSKSTEIKQEYIKPDENNSVELTSEELKETPLHEEIQEEPLVEEVRIEKPNTESSELNFIRNAAISNLTYGFNEEEAKQVERYIIETNPNITKAQAYFYARHCSIGKYYTISQFKKEIGCAYETARTSMDKLVSEGYYSKEGYKNKFLYTPIKRNK